MSKKIKTFYMSVFLTLALSVACFASAYADDSVYQDATVRLLNDHLFEEKRVDFEDPEAFKEYVIIEDCPVYQKFFTNDFDWNRIRLAIKAEMEGLKPRTQRKKIRVPGLVALTRYNFSTQSFDIHEDYVFKSVGFLQLLNSQYKLCGGDFDEGFIGRAIPNQYFLKPEIPFNLYRIPISKVLAQRILDTIKPNKDATRDVYIDINVTLDTFFEIDQNGTDGVTGHVLGTIDHIDFYADEFRQDKFKTLYYSVY